MPQDGGGKLKLKNTFYSLRERGGKDKVEREKGRSFLLVFCVFITKNKKAALEKII